LDFKLHHIAIQSSDLEKSLWFYHQILGFPIIKRETSSKGRMIVWLEAGEARIELYTSKPGQALISRWDQNGLGPVSMGFIVSDLVRAVYFLKQKNVLITKLPYEPIPGERAAMISGPDGEEVVLLEKLVSC